MSTSSRSLSKNVGVNGKAFAHMKAIFYGRYDLKEDVRIQPVSSTMSLNSSDINFDADEAYSYLEKLMQHRKTHEKNNVKLKCYRNGIRIIRISMLSSAPSGAYSYSDIKKYFVFHAQPAVICLAMRDTTSHYLFIRLENQERVDKLSDIIDEMKTTLSDSVMNINNSQSDVRNERHVHDSTVEDGLSDYLDTEGHSEISSPSTASLKNGRKVMEERVLASEVFPVTEKVLHEANHSRNHSKGTTRQIVVEIEVPKTKKTGVKSIHSDSSSDWEGSEIYLSNDPIKGIRVVDDGPICMYSAHKRRTKRASSTSSSSSNSSKKKNVYEDAKVEGFRKKHRNVRKH